MEIPKVNLVQTAELLHTWITAGNAKPVILWGAPGIGKSAVIKALADTLEYGFIDLRLSQLEAVDLRGVPTVNNGVTTWNVPSSLPQVETHGAYGILFLDEFFLGAPSVRAAAYQLLQDREVGDYRLPDGWIILAASNRPEDKAGIAGGQFDSALTNRFAAHFEIVPDVDAWAEWALGNGVSPELVAFIRFRPELIHEFAEGGIPKGKVAYSTPRSLVAADNWLKLELAPSLEQAALEGCIGAGVAAELAGFLQIVRTLPDVGSIISHPDTSDVPTETSTLYALASLLGKRADPSTFGAVIRYLSRTSEEFVILAVSIATTRDESLKATQAYIDFKINHKDINI